MSRLCCLALLAGACAARPLDLPAPSGAPALDLAVAVDAAAPPDLTPPPPPDLAPPPDLLPPPSLCGLVRSFAAGYNPIAVSVGDINHDGKLDLVAGDYQQVAYDLRGVSVLLGHGDGTLGPATLFAARNDYVSDVPLADLDGDGNLDIIASSGASNPPVVSVLFGDGAGSFTPLDVPIATVSGLAPFASVTGDFNKDGKLDIATANSSGVGIGTSVMLNRGMRTFAAPTTYDVTWGSESIATGDFNNDGVLDLVRNDPFPDGDVNAPGRIALLIGRGDGSFAPATFVSVGLHVSKVATADLNRDGRLDLIATAYSGDRVGVLLGNGDGSFSAAPQLTPMQPRDAIAADWDHDGRLDLIVGGNSGVAVYVGNGDGTFGDPEKCPAAGRTYQVATGDFDSDGRLDIASANMDDNVVRLLLTR
jgi:hypothetical protein